MEGEQDAQDRLIVPQERKNWPGPMLLLDLKAKWVWSGQSRQAFLYIQENMTW